MDSLLAEAGRKLCADSLFDLVRTNYHKANTEYIQKQINIASAYLTEEQKQGLRERGYLV